MIDQQYPGGGHGARSYREIIREVSPSRLAGKRGVQGAKDGGALEKGGKIFFILEGYSPTRTRLGKGGVPPPSKEVVAMEASGKSPEKPSSWSHKRKERDMTQWSKSPLIVAVGRSQMRVPRIDPGTGKAPADHQTQSTATESAAVKFRHDESGVGAQQISAKKRAIMPIDRWKTAHKGLRRGHRHDLKRGETRLVRQGSYHQLVRGKKLTECFGLPFSGQSVTLRLIRTNAPRLLAERRMLRKKEAISAIASKTQSDLDPPREGESRVDRCMVPDLKLAMDGRRSAQGSASRRSSVPSKTNTYMWGKRNPLLCEKIRC